MKIKFILTKVVDKIRFLLSSTQIFASQVTCVYDYYLLSSEV